MAKASKAKQLVVTAPNRVGLLNDIASAVAGARVNIAALCAYARGDQATFLMIVDRHATAKKALEKAGFQASEESVIHLELPNKAGEMAQAAAKIAGAGVDMEYIYATTAGRNGSIVIKAKDEAGALKALRK